MKNEHDNTSPEATQPTAEDRRLDEVLDAIRAESPDATEARDRVRRRLSKEVGWGTIAARPAAVIEMAGEAELRECADYQALLPQLRSGELSEARALLVQDHVRHCVTCRRASKQLEQGVAERPAADGTPTWRKFALAASFFAAIFASWFAWRNFWPSDQADLLEIKSIEGQLFALHDGQLDPLYPGDVVDGRQEIRTAKDSGAVLELMDGSRVEINERSALEVERKRSGLRVRVDRGDIIVEAAKQRRGTLDVTTDEMLVAVKGTIFAVSHGTKGSRVSVVEGEVQVEQSRTRTALYPGDQLGSRETLVSLPMAQELSWSSNVERYLTMLEEFGALRDSINQVLASAQPRYSSELLEQVPADTVAYIALPNPTATLTEVYSMVRQRVAANPQLLGQWEEFDAGGIGKLDDFVSSVQQLSEFLGEETVVALGWNELSGGDPRPMVLSEVENSIGLRSALEAKIAEIQAEHPEFNVVLLDPNSTTVPSGDDNLLVFIGNDLLVATTEVAEINRIASGTSSGFVGSAFHGKVTEAYDRGAEYLGAVDLGALIGSHMNDVEDDALRFTGLGSVEYLVVERSQDEERAHTAADLSFAGEREGMAAWLAEPAAMESLEFISPTATFASGAVHKDPALILDEVFEMALQDGDALDELERVQSELGIRFRDDLAAALGGEVSVALDGPFLPTPSWKVVLEVYDERRLQATIETLFDKVAEESEVEVIWTQTEVDGRIMYELEVETPQADTPSLFDGPPGIAYAYVDGFMVVAPTTAMVRQAILQRDSGVSLVTSEVFQDLLPRDRYVDFSAVVFNRVGETVADLAAKLPTPEGMTDEQRGQVDALLGEIAAEGPSIYCLYGESDRIRLVSNSSTFVPFSGLATMISLPGLLGAQGAPGLTI